MNIKPLAGTGPVTRTKLVDTNGINGCNWLAMIKVVSVLKARQNLVGLINSAYYMSEKVLIWANREEMIIRRIGHLAKRVKPSY